MQIIHFVSGDDGKTHVRDLTPEQLAEIAYRFNRPVTVAAPNSQQNRPGGFFADWHPLPQQAQLLIMCTGVSQYESAEGWRRLYPGDVVLMEDPTGQGHRFHVLGSESRIALTGPASPANKD